MEGGHGLGNQLGCPVVTDTFPCQNQAGAEEKLGQNRDQRLPVQAADGVGPPQAAGAVYKIHSVLPIGSHSFS